MDYQRKCSLSGLQSGSSYNKASNETMSDVVPGCGVAVGARRPEFATIIAERALDVEVPGAAGAGSSATIE